MKSFLVWLIVLITGIFLLVGGLWTISNTAPVISSIGTETCAYNAWQIAGAFFLEVLACFLVVGGEIALIIAFWAALGWWHRLRNPDSVS
jgi:uncharacterized membrane protein YjjP (DUF1212 family)